MKKFLPALVICGLAAFVCFAGAVNMNAGVFIRSDIAVIASESEEECDCECPNCPECEEDCECEACHTREYTTLILCLSALGIWFVIFSLALFVPMLKKRDTLDMKVKRANKAERKKRKQSGQATQEAPAADENAQKELAEQNVVAEKPAKKPAKEKVKAEKPAEPSAPEPAQSEPPQPAEAPQPPAGDAPPHW